MTEQISAGAQELLGRTLEGIRSLASFHRHLFVQYNCLVVWLAAKDAQNELSKVYVGWHGVN